MLRPLLQSTGRVPQFVRSMSVRPELVPNIPNPAPPKKVTLQRLYALRVKGIPITALTAYDFPTARQCEQNRVDICLVGDSLAQVCLGYDATTQLTLDEMVHHCKAVRRGLRSPFLVADLPFGTYLASPADTVKNAVRLIQEGGVESVKLEGGAELVPTVRALSSVGIPVMAHIGLLPQRHVALSGYRIQGRDARSALSLRHAARAMQAAGAWGLVLEGMPHTLAAHITKSLDIPTIGIGAGPGCSGQILVWDDAMGAWAGHQAKFVRRFADLGSRASEGVRAYIEAVRERRFPDPQTEGYEMPETEWEEYLKLSEAPQDA